MDGKSLASSTGTDFRELLAHYYSTRRVMYASNKVRMIVMRMVL